MSEFINQFCEEMCREREYQQERWGDNFDSKNTPNDWVSYIIRYAGLAVTGPWQPEVFKKQLVKVATLCAAAYEWCDRTNGEMSKRHYD